MRRSFRTHQLCAIPGVSPRAGMRCPVGELRTPHLSRGFLRPHAPTTTHRVNDDCFPQRRPSNHPILGQESVPPKPQNPTPGSPKNPPLRHHPPAHPGRQRDRAGASIGSDQTPPLAHSAKASPYPELPCERRPDPAEPRRGTDPQRQPRHSATAKQSRAPGGMRRSFRTLRLCAIPGVSPRAGMRCPVGALRTPHHPRAFPRSPHKYAQRSGIEPERALEANTKNPSRTARKPLLPRASSASAGSIPRSPHRAPGPRVRLAPSRRHYFGFSSTGFRSGHPPASCGRSDPCRCPGSAGHRSSPGRRPA